jgi:hypothetical protein
MTPGGLSSFQTGDPTRLNADLQRNQAAVAARFSELERRLEPRISVRFAGSRFGTRRGGPIVAAHGEMLIVGGTGEVVNLPKSSAQTAGRSLIIAIASADDTVKIEAAPDREVNGGRGNLIMGAPVVEFVSFYGMRRFIDDGTGNWWVDFPDGAGP